MNNKLFCNLRLQAQAIRGIRGLIVFLLAVTLFASRASAGSDAPQWMHALVSVPVPAHDDKTDAVLLYSETNVTVLSADKIKTHVREAYKILRPNGRRYGTVYVNFDSLSKVNSIHGWCIPAQGKDYEVKDKDAIEQSPWADLGINLQLDEKRKVLRIPAPDPGNIVGYEFEKEEQPLVLQDVWYFQESAPVRESHYSLQLPPGWEYKASWLNYPEAKPQTSADRVDWSLSDVKEVREEEDMPPWRGVAGHMIISFFPSGGAAGKIFANWSEMGSWYEALANGRRDASPEIKQKTKELVAGSPTVLGQMRAIAQFVQHDVRYLAIELGIGGWQPHSATQVFNHRYGDCKDKAVLMASMLHEIGIESYYVVINMVRGSVSPATPAYTGAFNHVMLAIKLPPDVDDASLVSIMQHPKLGKVLFFNPTDEVTPFGQIKGHLQANYGLLVAPAGGELIELPVQPTAMNSIRRDGKLSLDTSGTLKGDIKEVRLGDRAWSQRWALRSAVRQSEQIKPIESVLADSISTFQITKANAINLSNTDRPLGFEYSFEAPRYAKNAGDLLLLRPRVLGTKSSGILETKEPRKFPIEFDGPVRDSDRFEITLPDGYQVDELTPPVDADFGFASYHSKTEAKGNVVTYSRVFEVKELSVPVSRADDLKKFYRIIAGDERNAVVLKAAGR